MDATITLPLHVMLQIRHSLIKEEECRRPLYVVHVVVVRGTLSVACIFLAFGLINICHISNAHDARTVVIAGVM